MFQTRPKPVALLILDGWGLAPASPANAVTLARTPNLDSYISDYPVATLGAAGEAVGLFSGQMGNSEVGHLSLGSGRVIYQNLPRISKAISDGSFFTKPEFLEACARVKKNHSSLHLLGLVSNGGVHSSNEHLYALLKLAKDQAVERVYIHVFLDGRDTLYNAGAEFVGQLEDKIKEIGIGQIATVSGRFYAMDRDNHWEGLRGLTGR
jgi:2,3-bisphosphoglycerate-independent phosphoglycerate mutase